jgi:Tol biopolymer transport system component
LAVMASAVIAAGAYLLTRQGQDKLPSIACDKLAFASGRNVYLVNPDGSGLVRLLRSPEDGVTRLSWSPDGTHLAFNTSHLDMYDGRLFMVAADGRDFRLFADLRAHTTWEWSPDSRYIRTRRGSTMGLCSVEVMDVETGQVDCGDFYSSYDVARCDPFELSDGRWWTMAWSTTVLDRYEQRWAFATMHEQSVVQAQALSPDKAWVVLAMFDPTTEQTSWFIAKSDGEGLRPVSAPVTIRAIGDAAWSPDSQHFAISVCKAGSVSIWVSDVSDDQEGSGGTFLATLPAERCTASLMWATGGRYLALYVYDSEDTLAVYVVEWPGGRLHTVKQALPKWPSLRWLSEADSLLIASSPPSIWNASTHRTASLGADLQKCQWSPDDRWLACAGETNTVVLNLASGERIGADMPSERPAWSPNGRWVAVETSDGLYTFDVETRQTNLVTDREVDAFAWSPTCDLDQSVAK